VTLDAERGRTPGTLMAMALNLPRADLDAYTDDVVRTLAELDARWQRRAAAAPDSAERVLAGGVVAVGELGAPIDAILLADMQRGDPKHLQHDDDDAPTYRRYYDEHGNLVRRAHENGGDS
jgi:hypothetical protein